MCTEVKDEGTKRVRKGQRLREKGIEVDNFIRVGIPERVHRKYKEGRRGLLEKLDNRES